MGSQLQYGFPERHQLRSPSHALHLTITEGVKKLRQILVSLGFGKFARFFWHGSRGLTSELSDAGGPARPNSQLTWPAHVRSSDFVRRHLSISLEPDASLFSCN